MAYSHISYAGDGVTQDYIIPFGYIKIDDVHVSIDDTDQTYITDYTYLSTGTLRFTTPPPLEANVRIQRLTDKEILSVDFRDGSTLTERDLDLAFLQLLYICQEAYDALDGETAVAAKNRAEEILRQMTELRVQLLTEIEQLKAQTVEEARKAAAVEADRAENAADLAQLVNYVSGARDTLTVTENLAVGSVVDLPPGLAYLVGRHHLNITYDGISLSPSFYEEIGEAGKSSTRVKFLIPLYAGQEIDFWLIPLGEAGPLLDQMRNMAEETEDKADAAAASAGAAAASASDAETKAAEAAGSAGEAARSAEAAGASAVSAGRDASDAAASASAARNQAGIATTSAEEAASSATAASGSADEATTSAEAAASSASGAASAAETATQKATAAATSATNAAASAGSAETKAAEAAQSAEEAAQKLAEMEAIVATSLPAQEGNAGKFLTTDGTNASWGDVPESVELSDSVTSASSTTAASSRAVKTAHDKATEAQTEAIRVDACLVTDLADVPAGLRTGGVIILETSAPAPDTDGA